VTDRFDRILGVLLFLRGGQAVSATALARRFAVSTRTIHRDLKTLEAVGVPVYAGRGRDGGLRLAEGYFLPPLMFTEDEALALTLGLLAARRLGLTSATPAVEGALAKIERVLPLALRERVWAVQETLILDFANAGPTLRTNVVVTLCTAMQQQRRVSMRYASFNAEESERAVDLYGLVYRPGYWYAVGYCHLRQDLRVFRLDRIAHAEIGSETYTRPAGFDPLEYVSRSLAMTPRTWPVEVLVEAKLEEARRYVPAVVATLEETPTGLVMRCSTGNLAWFAHLLTELPFAYTVRQPAELRAELQKIAARIAEMASRE